MRKKYLSLLLFLLPILVFSQKSLVKGTVTDKDDNPGIATVRISGPTLKTDEGAQTDEQGSFAIQVVPGTYVIRITQQSHKDFVDTIVVEKDKNFNLGTVRLREAPVELGVYEV